MTHTPRQSAPQRAALVTGASRGLGLVVARFLAARGRRLVIDARGAGELERAADGLRSLGADVVAIAGDVADPAHRDALLGAARGAGGLELLVNNASTLGATPLPPLVELPVASLRRAFEVNVAAPLALVQGALPLLGDGGGLIVDVSSDAAVAAYPTWGAYAASKSALDTITRTLAAELRDAGVGAVSVDPGDMRTVLHQRAYPGEDIGDRPLPDVTLPFWAWLFTQEPLAVTGRRFEAQGDHWLRAAGPVLA